MEAAQVAKTRIAGAEIIQRYGDAEFVQLMQDRDIGFCLRQEYRLGVAHQLLAARAMAR